MRDPVSLNVALSEDKSELVLTIWNAQRQPLAHANLGPDQVRFITAQLVQGLLLLEGEVPDPVVDPETDSILPIPIPTPKYCLAQLDTGEPVIAFEACPAFWVSFSLTVLDGVKLRDGLSEMVDHPSRL